MDGLSHAEIWHVVYEARLRATITGHRFRVWYDRVAKAWNYEDTHQPLRGHHEQED